MSFPFLGTIVTWILIDTEKSIVEGSSMDSRALYVSRRIEEKLVILYVPKISYLLTELNDIPVLRMVLG
jgi:hypothetical protein